MAFTALVHHKYWTKQWEDQATSYKAVDHLKANNACPTLALSFEIVVDGGLMDLRANNIDLAKRLEVILTMEMWRVLREQTIWGQV